MTATACRSEVVALIGGAHWWRSSFRLLRHDGQGNKKNAALLSVKSSPAVAKKKKKKERDDPSCAQTESVASTIACEDHYFYVDGNIVAFPSTATTGGRVDR
jgi:hypothetical protein